MKTLEIQILGLPIFRKIRIMQTLVFPVTLYGNMSWSLKMLFDKSSEDSMNRQVINKWIIKYINPDFPLETHISR